MWRAPLSVIIFLAVLGAGAATWWLGSADERRVSACREAGIENAAHLARCAESAEASKAVLKETKDKKLAKFRERLLEATRALLVELRAGARSKINKSRYERLPVERLVERYEVAFPGWIEQSSIPAGLENQYFALEGGLTARDEDSGYTLSPRHPKKWREDEPFRVTSIAADIGGLKRSERKFAREACGRIYAHLTYGTVGCPVIAYGRVEIESAYGFLAQDTLGRGRLEPVFRMEAVEFFDPPQP